MATVGYLINEVMKGWYRL